jgi:Family of unknown function (DUF5681)
MTTENSEPKHLWKPGVSGNPAGKPRGTKSKSTQLMTALFGKNPQDLRDIVSKTIECAKVGKPWAVELILARLWPVPKGRTVTFQMADIASVEDIGRAFSGLWAATSQGFLTPDEAVQLGALLKDHAAALESSEIERRLRDLEADAERRVG